MSYAANFPSHFIVHLKDGPVSPLNARVTIFYPAFFIMHGIEGGRGWVGVSQGCFITPLGVVGVGRCLTRLINHPQEVEDEFPKG